MAYDITEGRSSEAIAVDIGVTNSASWTNNGIDYDCAVSGIPFLMGINDQHPYERQTVQFRKNQFDSQRDPGEQSLSTWWMRSQSSFHAGYGVKYYDPFANPFSTTLASNSYRFDNSMGVNVFNFGQVSLLNRTSNILATTSAVHLESVQVSGVDKIAMLDSDIKIVDATTSSTLVAHSTAIYSFATDGNNVYYIDGGNVYKKALTGGSSTTLYTSSTSVTSSAMHWVKQRLVASMNNNLYELAGGTGGALPTPVYTHPNTSWVWTDIDEAGPAIYASGYAGTNSAIYMFVLTSTGASAGSMPVLTSGIVAAQLPQGEVIYSLYSHLGTFLVIGTNKGVRVAQVDQATGYLNYGPLLVNTSEPVRGFAARDSYVWFGSAVSNGTTNYSGTWRIDLSDEIDTLRYATAQDVYAESTVGGAFDVAFLGNTNQVAFIANTSGSTSGGSLGLWLTSATELIPTGYIQTGQIRYNTLEGKNFKRVIGRGSFNKGSMDIQTVAQDGTLYEIIQYNPALGAPEVGIATPSGSQDSMGLRFVLNRDSTDNTTGPVFKGYQLKAIPATPRSRMIRVPLFCYDFEEDKYNVVLGYEGRAWEILQQLETLENLGDVVTWQDLRTGETAQALIEEISFTNHTPPDRRLNGFGGLIMLTLRTV